MLDRFLGRIHDTEHGPPALRIYLWWGLLIRGILAVALGTLLVVKGNVLAEWVVTSRLPFVSPDDVGELTAISYSVIFVLLVLGTGARWSLLRRLKETETGEMSTEKPAAEEDSTAGEK